MVADGGVREPVAEANRDLRVLPAAPQAQEDLMQGSRQSKERPIEAVLHKGWLFG